MPRLNSPSGIVEFARLVGVAPSMISRALAGSPRVAEATRLKIEALAREHGFRLNQTARNLRRQKTDSIGVAIPLGHEIDQNISDPFFMTMLSRLMDEIIGRGYDLLLSRIVPSDDEWLDRLVDSGRIDGIVVMGQSNQIGAIERVAGRYKPLVVWGAVMPGYKQVTVGTDNFAGGKKAAEHLIAQGRIQLVFAGNPELPEFADRYAGFKAALRNIGADEAGLVIPAHLTTEIAYNEFCAFLDRGPKLQGIVAVSDVIAMSALRALNERGIRVPDDVAVIGYDDVMVARYATPPLTTIRQNISLGASLLAERLFRLIEGQPAESIMMEPELVVRESA